jgi:hypothetical protein
MTLLEILGKSLSAIFVIQVYNAKAIKGHTVGKLQEGIFYILQVLVKAQMLPVYVGDHRNRWMQF